MRTSDHCNHLPNGQNLLSGSVEGAAGQEDGVIQVCRLFLSPSSNLRLLMIFCFDLFWFFRNLLMICFV